MLHFVFKDKIHFNVLRLIDDKLLCVSSVRDFSGAFDSLSMDRKAIVYIHLANQESERLGTECYVSQITK